MSPSRFPNGLPIELVNLLAMHSSFLTALSLQYAHNGIATPVDLRALTESVSSVWRMRKVTYDDIRLCVGVSSCGPTGHEYPFYLSDYGRGKICLEIREGHKLLDGMTSINEEALKLMFQEGLDSLWMRFQPADQLKQKIAARPIAAPKRRGRPKKSNTKQISIQSFIVDESSISEFIAQLPLAEITTCASLTAIAPLQEKGRKRLREFKDSQQQGRAQKKARETTGKENEPVHTSAQQAQPTQAKITEFAAVRKTNLLDRILAKQAAVASGPTPPTPAELQRKAALHRAEEVLGVLSLLCASKGPGMRVSFSMPTLLQALQSSSRSPVSKDEAMKCIEVLASEVAPGYLSVVRMGAISSVVVNQAMRPVDMNSRLGALRAT